MIAWITSLALAGTPSLPCDAYADGMPTGPVSLSYYDGALAAPTRACPRSEVGGGIGANMVVQTEEFYGNVIARGELSGSYAPSDRFEVRVGLEPVRFQTTIASLSDSALGLGHLSMGATWQFARSEKWAFALTGGGYLPTATGLYVNAWPTGGQLSITGAYAPSDVVSFHHAQTLFGTVAFTKGPVIPRFGLASATGVEIRPAKVFAFALDVDTSFHHDARLDHVSAALALRFSDAKRFGFDVSLMRPLAGWQPALVVAGLKGTYRF